jgi:L-histidine N-alpha-methyltransferase
MTPESSGTALVRLDVHLTDADADTALRDDARRGLTARPKELPPKWFYDARGSELFEQITDLPEYYPFRTERALLTDSVADIAHVSGAETVVELGSGSSTKTRLLLDAFRAEGTLRSYVPQDVSESALRGALDELSERYPDLALHGVVGDFTRDLVKLPAAATPGGRRMIAFLGGTIGNLLPGPRHEFLTHVRSVLAPGEQLLIGTGLVTDPAVMVPAYDDAQGVTAEFNRNVLHVLNRELDADFDVDAFSHVAYWDAEQEWIEMRLRAERDMAVRVAALDLDITFARGEVMCTEVSAKFRHETIDAMVGAAGFEPTRRWVDPDERFALSLVTSV